jgi:GntR family transcriptional repressor for pyruvate dehydrogenase complex
MMNFESDERNLPQKISEDIISFILNEHLQAGVWNICSIIPRCS